MPPSTPRPSAVRSRLAVSFGLVVCLLVSLVAINARAATPAVSSPAAVVLAPRVLSPDAPRYQTYTPPAGAPFGSNAGEPTVGVDFATGKVLFLSQLDTLRIGFDDCTSPAKTTFEAGRPPNTPTSLDPFLHTDETVFTKTDGTKFCRTFVSQLAGKASLSAFTDDDGKTFTLSQGNTPLYSGVDHQTYGAGPYRPGSPAELVNQANGTPFKHALYYCSQDIADANCNRSDDGGMTFTPVGAMYTAATCAGLHGHVQVAPNGMVYVPNKSCGGKQGMAVSADNGLTFTVRTVPTSIRGSNDPAIGIGANNTVYFGYQQGTAAGNSTNTRPKVAVSRDGGQTFTDDQIVGQELGIQNIVFPTMIAGDDDRAAFAFVGTTTGGDYQNMTAAKDAIWHLYVSHTFDGGKTWTTVDTTPTDPVQRGSICTGGTTCGNDRNLLDFIDIEVDQEGHAVVGYADGCIGSCVNNPPNSFSALASIARQSGGKRLFAAKDPANELPGAPLVTAAKENGAVQLSWPVPDNGGAEITGYNVYRRTDGGSYPPTPLATVTETRYTDVSADPNTTYFYQVTTVNAAGEESVRLACQEVTPVVIVRPDPCNLPGVLVVPDASDDGVVNDARVDIKSISIAEPFQADGSNKLVFTLKVGPSTGTTAPPNSMWYIISQRPITLPMGDTNDRNYVAMRSDATGAVSFEYGKIGAPAPTSVPGNAPTKGGNIPADMNTKYDAKTGTIQITVGNDKFDNIAAGTTLTAVQARTFLGRNDMGPITQTAATDSSGFGTYTLFGNAFCQPSVTPVAALQANPRTGAAPLLVNFDGSASRVGDATATIASYTFNFGDGQSAVTQPNAVVSHTYTNPGSYRATLSVTDSQGRVSENVAAVVIEVFDANAAPTPTGTGEPELPTLTPPPGPQSTPTILPSATAGSLATARPNGRQLFLPLIQR